MSLKDKIQYALAEEDAANFGVDALQIDSEEMIAAYLFRSFKAIDEEGAADASRCILVNLLLSLNAKQWQALRIAQGIDDPELTGSKVQEPTKSYIVEALVPVTKDVRFFFTVTADSEDDAVRKIRNHEVTTYTTEEIDGADESVDFGDMGIESIRMEQ